VGKHKLPTQPMPTTPAELSYERKVTSYNSPKLRSSGSGSGSDFLNISAEKSAKNAFLTQNKTKLFKKLHHKASHILNTNIFGWTCDAYI
jgi:hypothetical protein